jgi:hypothetical protein
MSYLHCVYQFNDFMFKSLATAHIVSGVSILFNTYTWFFLPGLNLPEREANNLPPSSAEVKNDCNYILTPSTCHYGLHRDKYTLATYGGS